MPWAPLNFGFKTNALTKKIDSNESWDCIGSNTLYRIPSGSKILECHSQKELLDVQEIFLLKCEVLSDITKTITIVLTTVRWWVLISVPFS